MTVNIGYDFEFLEHEVLTHGADGRPRKVMTIEPISIGLKVYRGGPSYYAVFRDAPWAEISRSPFLMEHVVPKLPRLRGQFEFDVDASAQLIDPSHPDVKPHRQIAAEVSAFLLDAFNESPRLELWADYCAFDHVSLAWLWGTMIDLPSHVPMRTNDLMQLAASCGVAEQHLPHQDPRTVHHSGHDAAHGEVVFNHIFDTLNQKAESK